MARQQPSSSQQAQWQSIRDCKLADVASRIPQEWQIPSTQLPPPTQANVLDVPRTCGILTPREIHITEDYNARELANAIRQRRFTAIEVTTAFCKRAAISHQLTTCITEPLFSSALSRAEHLDAHLARTGSPLGPLHGLPISVKDSFWVKGVDSSIGIASLCNKPAPKNATIVDILLGAGAVIHCKTNVPQTLMALDSINNIFGRTLNPLNRQGWTAGGSSGGEGVLVKMRGSVLGVGTDVGGSVRIPAMCNGIYGFKPSQGRIPGEGQTGPQLEAAGKVGMESVVGPIARELGDIELFMEVVEAAEAWKVEAAMVPGSWWSGSNSDLQEKKKKKNILIGVVQSDGVTSPLPPVRRMLSDTVHLLQNAGVEVIDVPTPRFKDCQSLCNKFFNAEGGAHTFSLLAQTSEPLIPWLEGRFKQKIPATVDTLRDLQAQKIRLQNDFLSVWMKTDDGRAIDAFICPVAPHPVPGIDRWNTVGYTSAFVLLDYPAAVVPIRSVTRDDLEEEMMEGEVLGGWDKVNRGLWDGERVDRETYLGSPLCVQVVGPRLQERRVWDVCGVMEEAVRGVGKGVGVGARL